MKAAALLRSLTLRQTGNQFNSCNTGDIYAGTYWCQLKREQENSGPATHLFKAYFPNYHARIFNSDACFVILELYDSLLAIQLRRQSTSQSFSPSRKMEFLTIQKNTKHKKVKNAKTTLSVWYIDPLIRPSSIKILVAKIG